MVRDRIANVLALQKRQILDRRRSDRHHSRHLNQTPAAGQIDAAERK
jgi:hypothetical protein